MGMLTNSRARIVSWMRAIGEMSVAVKLMQD